MGDALDDLLNLAERAYLRMQASQLIARCLEEGDAAILENLLQELVLAGVPSLAALREIREEIRGASRTLRREGAEVWKKLGEALAGLGVGVPKALSAGGARLSRLGLGRTLKAEVQQAAIALSPEDRRLVEVLCEEANEQVIAIARRLALLRRLDGAVSDWLECVAYEAVRFGPRDGATPSRPLH